MWRAVLVFTLLSFVNGAKDVNLFVGKWLPTATYPKIPTFPMCLWYDIILPTDDYKCKCNDKAVPAFEFKTINHDDGNNKKELTPVIIVESSSEVTEALNSKCTCKNTPKEHLVFKYINEDYFVYYVLLPATNYTEKDPNTAVLATKNYVTTKELDLAQSQIDDLKDRERAYLCDPKNYEYYLMSKGTNH